MVFEYKQLPKNNFFSYFLNLINICHNSHNCICIPYIGHEKSCVHHCTPIYMYGQIFIRSYFKAKDTTTHITDILPLQLESVPKVHNILSRCFTAGHLSCCLVLSTGRTLLLQTEWCHSPAPTKTIKTVSIEFKFTRWHKVELNQGKMYLIQLLELHNLSKDVF